MNPCMETLISGDHLSCHWATDGAHLEHVANTLPSKANLQSQINMHVFVLWEENLCTWRKPHTETERTFRLQTEKSQMTRGFKPTNFVQC